MTQAEYPINDQDSTRTWRDLADLLTPEQIAELQYCERYQIPPGIADADHRNCAQMMGCHNFVQRLCADIAAPADAGGEISEWEEWGAGYGRMYTVSSRGEVEIFGVQFDDGRIERNILCRADDTMTAAQARQLAQTLVEAANELDRLS
jgi:hypothetical protein